MSRNPARKGRSDSNQPAIAQAIQALGCPVMDLSAAGNGVEDLLVGIRFAPDNSWEHPLIMQSWLLVECKVPPIKYTSAQKAWRERTAGWPRITATSGQDAIRQIREMTG